VYLSYDLASLSLIDNINISLDIKSITHSAVRITQKETRTKILNKINSISYGIEEHKFTWVTS